MSNAGERPHDVGECDGPANDTKPPHGCCYNDVPPDCREMREGLEDLVERIGCEAVRRITADPEASAHGKVIAWANRKFQHPLNPLEEEIAWSEISGEVSDARRKLDEQEADAEAL